jgi:uncharacterized membrane protein YfcA
LIEPSNGAAEGRRNLLSLALVGLVAGLFAAMFGVGGGIVMVPLLIALLRYDAKVATATSLAAIIFTATWGTATHGALGNVDWGTAALVGIPAMLGVTIGIGLKARISSAQLTYGFAVVLVLVAARMAFA